MAFQLQKGAAELEHHHRQGWRKPSEWSCTVCARSRAGMLWPGVWECRLDGPLTGLEMLTVRAPRQHLIYFSRGHQELELVLPYFTWRGPKSWESLRPEVDAACPCARKEAPLCPPTPPHPGKPAWLAQSPPSGEHTPSPPPQTQGRGPRSLCRLQQAGTHTPPSGLEQACLAAGHPHPGLSAINI